MTTTRTAIEWTDATWSPLRGCSIVSRGCTNCYAMKHAHRFSGAGMPYEGLTRLTKGGPVWTGDVRLVPEVLDAPLRWRKPRRIFANSMSDLFHEAVPNEFIDRVFAVMQACPQHTFQVLTKRPERMRAYVAAADGRVREAGERLAGERGWCHAHEDGPWPLPNVWLGVSVEDQAAADERIPLLLQTPAAVRFLSVEPLLGPVNLRRVDANRSTADWCLLDALAGSQTDMGRPCPDVPRVDWIIVGGESGSGARPCDVSWIRSVVEQCRGAKVACFVKQLGAYAVLDPRYDRSIAPATRRLRDRKGADPEEWPADLRVREMPEARQA